MLKEITIKNFKSFADETTFSMEADLNRVSEYASEHITKNADCNILKVTSMYGPNGGGKTNLLEALTFVKSLITHTGYGHFVPRTIKNVFTDSDVSEFTIFFVDDDYELGYNIEVKSEISEFDKAEHILYELKPQILFEEAVYRKTGQTDFTSLYTREKTGIINSPLFEKYNIKFPQLALSKTVLNKVYEDYADNDSNEYEFMEIIKRLYIQFMLIYKLRTNENERLMILPLDFISKHENDIINHLKSVDINISKINIYKTGRPEQLYFEREIEIDGKPVKREISLDEESSGTKKIFQIILSIMNGIKKNKIFLCDDMDAYLHPKLIASIIGQFTSKDNKKSQLLFNSHDLINMNKETFRRDEIWFAYRNERYSTMLVPLSGVVNYKNEPIRNDAKYSKQYLEGKYGADPFINKGLKWYE